MNKNLAKKWIKALRSGEYKQTKGALQDEYGHCCLGVLCEIGLKKQIRDSKGYLSGGYLGLQNANSILSNSSFQLLLASLNDSGYSNYYGDFIKDPLNFDEIADVIQLVILEGALDVEQTP